MLRLPLRLLPEIAADGAQQMCLDEALLVEAKTPSLRLYRFAPPTVSLGCFQDAAAICAQLPKPMPLVRRITGGGAIWHEHEITYCLVLPEAGPGSAFVHSGEVYARLHAGIAATVIAAGGQAERQTAARGDRRYRDEPRCFASPAVDDLVRDAAKILGSAARRRGDRLLVHGSLKLASNPWDGHAATDCGLSEAAAAAALRDGIASALHAELHADACTAGELATAAELRRQRYADDGWVLRREGPRP